MAIDRYFVEKSYTDGEYEQFIELTRDGAVAAYLYCNKVLADGKRRYYSDNRKVRAIGRGGIALVPVSFFADFLGCEVSGARVTKGEKSFEYKAEEKDGIVYVPAVEAATALGFAAKAYYNGQLILIGEKRHIDAVDENENLVEAGGFAVFGEYDTSEATEDDYVEAKRILRERLVGSPEINDMSDPFIKAKVDRISHLCGLRWSQMNKGEDVPILWGTKPPVESVELSTQYTRICEMALGYATRGSEYYHNEQLLKDIIFGLEWMNKNMYGEKEMRNEGWRNVLLFNWWYWLSGATDPMTDAILAIEEHLTDEQKKRFTKTYDGIRHYLHNAPSVKVMTKVGLLAHDPEKFMDCNALCENAMQISDACQKHTDFLNFTHGFPHNISYGSLVIENTLYVLSALAGTGLAYVGPKKYNFFLFLKYMFEPSMYNGRGYMMYLGRTTKGSESEKGAEVLSRLLALIGVFGDDEDRYIKTFIKRSVKNYPHIRKKMARHMTFLDFATLNDILADESIPDKENYEIAYVWYTGDRASWQRNNYGAAFAMASRRSFTYESINDMNKQGWYTGDGAHYIYSDYDSECFDGDNFLEKNMEVAYHFPGATEDQQARAIRSIRNGWTWQNPTDFSGGVKFKDKFLTAGMEFIAMHYEGPDDKVDTGYGGGLAPHNNDLKAKKAYFCFDNEVVCLGAGISSTMNSPVNTTLEHRRIIREDEFSQYIDGEKLPQNSFVKEYEGAEYFLMEGHAGYLVLDGQNTLARRYVSDTSGGQSFIEYRICHGENPTGATYAYVILPTVTKEGIEAYAKAPDVEIIANTERLQAVREKTLGCLGIVFHEAGVCEGISADVPCFIMTDGKELSVSEPSGKLEKIVITVDGEKKISSFDGKVTSSQKDGKTVIEIDIKGANGKPFTVKF